MHPTGLLTSHTIGGFLPAIVPVLPADRRRGPRARRAPVPAALPRRSRADLGGAARRPPSRRRRCRRRASTCEPRALTRREHRATWSTASRTAPRALREGGVDGIEVSFAHGYLVAQFFSPRTNLRDDEYDLEPAPVRREVLEAVREAAGARVAVGVRLAADEAPPAGSTPPPAPRSRAPVRRRPRRLRRPRARLLRDLAGSVGSCRRRRSSGTRSPSRRGRARRAAVGLPMIATTRVVDLADAERWWPTGAADAGRDDARADRRPGARAQGRRRRGREGSRASAATRAASATTTPGCRSPAS